MLNNNIQQNTERNFLYSVYKKTVNFLVGYEDKERKIAEEVNTRYNDVVLPPIWPDKIALAERFGIGQKNMQNDQVSFLDKKNKIIYLTSNKKLLEIWENFAVAHVLGKWFLGHLNSSFNPSVLKSSDREDIEANKFASYLLMPDNFVREYAWLEDDFAKVFRVPQEVVSLRMSLL